MSERGAVSSSWTLLDPDGSEVAEVDLLQATARTADHLYALDNPEQLAHSRGNEQERMSGGPE